MFSKFRKSPVAKGSEYRERTTWLILGYLKMVRLFVTTLVGLLVASAALAFPASAGEPGLTYIVPIASGSDDGATARRQLPDMLFADASGVPVHLRQFAGKVVVLTFWTTACSPCLKQMPSLDRLQGDFRKGLVVIALLEDQGGVAVAKSFLGRQKFNYLRPFADIGAGAASGAGIRGIPTTILIDKENMQAFKVEGPVDWESAMMSARIKDLLSE